MNKKKYSHHVVMVLIFAVFVVMNLVHTVSASTAQNWTGDGGKGISITILAPQATGLAENQSYIPALVQGEFISNFSGYSTIDVLDWKSRETIIIHIMSSPSYSDSVQTQAQREIGNLIPTTHFMDGKITKTATGYNLQMSIIKTSDKMTTASFSKTFTFDELDNLTGIRQASLELLQQMGVKLTAKAQDELVAAAEANHVNAQTALARGITAQRQGTEVAALSYYFQAATFDPSLMEAVNRSSILHANITSGNMGDNIRNDIQWRKQWVDRLTETELFFNKFLKTESMPYTLFYSNDIKQGRINYQNETIILSIETCLYGSSKWTSPIERALQTMYDGLNATGKARDWGLAAWPLHGVTNLTFARGSKEFSVIFELINNQNKVISTQTLETSGSWNLRESGDRKISVLGGFTRSDRPQININDGRKWNTLNFINVNANDITDNLTIRVSSVNNEAAETAVKNGVLQILTGEKITKGDSFKDSRNGKSYRTINITGNLTWMAENLDYTTSGSLCNNDNASNCVKYGRLYTWNAAINACPAGWRLPTPRDWSNLIEAVGGSNVAGKKLKSKTSWNGTDDYGFSALPGGSYYTFSHSDLNRYSWTTHGSWWANSTTEKSPTASGRIMTGNDNINSAGFPKEFGLAIRCVRD